MTQTYILVINGKPEGPFTIEELKQYAIKPSDFVKTPEMDDYKEAHEIIELRQLLGFERQSITPQYFGAFDQRLLAAVIDWLMISGVFIIIAFLIVLFIDDKATRIATTLRILGIIPVANLIYHIIMEGSAKQGTYGKQILKIRVTDMHGEPIGAIKATGRNLAKVFSVLSAFIGYFIAFFNKKQQCLHDMLAGTLVVKDRLI